MLKDLIVIPDKLNTKQKNWLKVVANIPEIKVALDDKITTEDINLAKEAKDILESKGETMENSKEYQGWTNSRTWNAAWLLGQNYGSYRKIALVRKEGKKVDAKFIRKVFYSHYRECSFESWVEGEVNWQEIADNYNDQEYN